MPPRHSKVGAPCWIDVMSSEPTRAVEFYTALFDWTAEVCDDPRYAGYTVLRRAGVPIAGVGQAPPRAPYTDLWTTYIETSDVAAALASAVTAGGAVLVPDNVVGEQGRMAVVSDSAGAAVGLWQPDEHPGFGTVGELGAPMWFELMARDYDAALSFYSQVFGWESVSIGDVDDCRYSQLRLGDCTVAGVMDADTAFPAGIPSFWQFYIGVADVDTFVAALLDLGGGLFREPEDTPYGRLASVSDPLGAAFQVMTPPLD